MQEKFKMYGTKIKLSSIFLKDTHKKSTTFVI